ncbi:unnamed protein product [Rhizopus stolonifer]
MSRVVTLLHSNCLLLRKRCAITISTRCLSKNLPSLYKSNSRNDWTDHAVILQKFRNESQTLEARLKTQILNFGKKSHIHRQAGHLGIKGKMLEELSKTFVVSALSGKIPGCSTKELCVLYSERENPAQIDRILFQAFVDHAKPFLSRDIISKLESLKKLSDLRFPSEWFPEARKMKRKIILHVGPTNSGKTYQALKRLQVAESGIYCGPLRLLAREIFERMNNDGIMCNLLTGEEKRQVSEDAKLTSSTVEMASLGKPLDVAVIDEIQMIADPDRGWAWTQALLGLMAKEVHLCGEESVVPLIQKIANDLGEQVVVNRYERLTPYIMSDTSLRADLSKIEKGDCVVAFSRKKIFDIKKSIEEATGLNCAVIYGGLPPETRSLQAKAFNDPDSGFDVLVASDAIGMGLNLNIRRIVFNETTKFDGKDVRRISISQAKQIAGRAGRFNTTYSHGVVTTLLSSDFDYIEEAINAPIAPLEMAGLLPTVDTLELFSLQMPDESFSVLLEKFEDLASVSGDYFLCNCDDQKKIADQLEDVRLLLRDRYQFVIAPVDTKSETSMKLIKTLAQKFSQKKTFDLSEFISLPSQCPDNPRQLRELEETHKQIILYMWLSLRYPDTFVTLQDNAMETKERCAQLIHEGLKLFRASAPSKKSKNYLCLNMT